MRGLAITSGTLILAAVAHVTISANGGYATPYAFLTLAVAFGVALGAVFSGAAWAAKRYALAVGLVAAIIAGEAFGFMATAERLIASREALQAPLRVANEKFETARRRVSDAVKLLDEHSSTSPRLEAALGAKNAADVAVVQKSAERGCLENCRKLLQAQADAASAEVTAARAEIDSNREALGSSLQKARASLASIKAPESATPLADRVGVPAWVIDLLHSALGSIAANGLACLLLTFGAHHQQAAKDSEDGAHAGPRPADTSVATARSTEHEVAGLPTPRKQSPTKGVSGKKPNKALNEHAAQFAVEKLRAAPSADVDLLEVHAEYKRWCEAKGLAPLPAAQIGVALHSLFESARIPITQRGGRMVLLGVDLQNKP